MSFDPFHDDGHRIGLLFWSQLSSCRNMVPFLKATSAAATSTMLSKEYGVNAMAHGRLFAIIRNNRRSETLGYKISRMLAYDIKPFLGNVLLVFLVQVEAAAEIRVRETLEQSRQVVLLGCSNLFFGD